VSSPSCDLNMNHTYTLITCKLLTY